MRACEEVWRDVFAAMMSSPLFVVPTAVVEAVGTIALPCAISPGPKRRIVGVGINSWCVSKRVVLGRQSTHYYRSGSTVLPEGASWWGGVRWWGRSSRSLVVGSSLVVAVVSRGEGEESRLTLLACLDSPTWLTSLHWLSALSGLSSLTSRTQGIRWA